MEHSVLFSLALKDKISDILFSKIAPKVRNLWILIYNGFHKALIGFCKADFIT